MADITKNRNYPEGLYQCTFKLLSNDAANQTNMAGNTINRRGLVNTTKSQLCKPTRPIITTLHLWGTFIILP